jgi:hypothetical protein
MASAAAKILAPPRATDPLRAIGVVDPRPYLSIRDGRAGRTAQPGETRMPTMTKFALAAAIVLSTAVAASAATDHYRATRGHPAIYNSAPAIISDECQPVGPPCRTRPDGW